MFVINKHKRYKSNLIGKQQKHRMKKMGSWNTCLCAQMSKPEYPGKLYFYYYLKFLIK